MRWPGWGILPDMLEHRAVLDDHDGRAALPAGRLLSWWIPLGLLAAYLLGMMLMPNPSGLWWVVTHSELGVIELGTAALYLLASVLAVRLAWRFRGELRRRYRALYVLFAAAALFVCLEEINYGQYLLGFGTPDWFMEHSTKGEMNLHNLAGNVPARRLNLLATLAFPLWCIVLPLVGRLNRSWWSPGHWSGYLLPRTELALVVVLAQGMSWLDDLFALCGWEMNVWARASEFKELYWGLGAAMLPILVGRRLQLWARLRSVRQTAVPVTADTSKSAGAVSQTQ